MNFSQKFENLESYQIEIQEKTFEPKSIIEFLVDIL